MKIEKTSFGKWSQAYRLERNGVEMIVLTEVGPRIISFRLAGGQNVLFADETVQVGRGDWRIYGGHRFWIAPESEYTYTPDDKPCEVQIDGEVLRVIQPVDEMRLQKVLEIGPSAEGDGFFVRHILRNVGDMITAGAIWGLTCTVPNRTIAPWSEGSASWQTNMVRYWRSWAGSATRIGSPQWRPTDEYFLVEPTGEVGKVGLACWAGLMASLRADGTFIKTFTPLEGVTYPDGGCNVALYTCAKFLEMETLGPIQTIYPGRELVHTEGWFLTGQTFEPRQWAQMQALLPQKPGIF